MIVIVVSALVLLAVAIPLVATATVWGSTDRVTLDREGDGATEPADDPAGGEEAGDADEAPPLQDEEPGELPSVVLLVGSDSREELTGQPHFGSFEGRRADVIVLAFVSQEEITLLSVPRDLWVADSCDDQGSHKIAEAFEGCDGRNGMAELVSELEGVFEVSIDHAAAVDMARFPGIVDAIGGYEICTDHPLRDREAGLDLPAGCTVAGGDTTLAWLRSRHTQRLVDGRWETIPAISDLVRNQRQREFIMEVFDRIRRLSGVTDVISVAMELAPAVTIDDELSLADAARWAWQLRSTPLTTEELPVADETTSSGEAILVPTEPPAEVAARMADRERTSP